MASRKKSSKSKAPEPKTHLEQAKNLVISVNSVDVNNYLDFLHLVDGEGDSFYNEKFVRNAIRRYEDCWIPLIQQASSCYDGDLDLAPPLGF